ALLAARRYGQEIQESPKVEELPDLRREAAEDEGPLRFLRLARQDEERAEAGAADVFDLAEIEEHGAAAFPEDRGRAVLQLRGVRAIHSSHDLDDGDRADLLFRDVQAFPRSIFSSCFKVSRLRLLTRSSVPALLRILQH